MSKHTPDSKQAEKDYLRRSGGGEWELLKPFPPAGQTATDEHAQHLLDFAVLLRVLALKPSDLILDLGAGSCWVSDWLRRFGFNTVAIDISLDMIQLGRRRLHSSAGLVAGDMEHLPFADGSFDKACCLNAFHHVPDTLAALREIRRVLKPDGVAFFSEPGAGHASQPTSIAASRNYGVLEREILIEGFMNDCITAGFSDALLHPISHVMPLFVLERSQWRDWSRYSTSKRPMRAIEKIWRGILELAGARKKDLLFEEAFAIRLVRELQPVIEQHPVVTTHCGPFVRPTPSLDKAAIDLLVAPVRGRTEAFLPMRVRVANIGSTTWNERDGEVLLGVQLLEGNGSLIDRNYIRHHLPTILPGRDYECELSIKLPGSGGAYQLKFDLVREGVRWFEAAGSKARVHDVEAFP